MRTRREFLKTSALSAAFLTTGGCVFSPTGSGGRTWTSAQLDRLDAAARLHGGRGWSAWQGSRRVASWNPDETGPSLSITKCIAALACVRAASEGWLRSDEKIEAVFPEWRGDFRKSRITPLQLLQQTSGLEAGVPQLYRAHPHDKGRAAAALAAIDEPGTLFRYGPSHWELLAEFLHRKLASSRSSGLPAFLRHSVLAPIGLTSSQWRADRKDIPYLSTGAEFSVDHLGRLGRLLNRLLRGENASGFDAAQFAIMTRPSSANPLFGGGLWRNTLASTGSASPIEIERSISNPLPPAFWNRACLSKRQPTTFATLVGSGGRRVYLWPDENRLIARLGTSAQWSDIRFLDLAS